MKLTSLLLFIVCMQASATGYSQITLREKNISIKALFKAIEKQSAYLFLYDPSEVKNIQNISINIENSSIRKVLDEALKGLPLTYQFIDENILVKKAYLMPVKNNPIVLADTLSGTVTNKEGEPIQGVSVQVKGTTSGTSTNQNGKYILRNLAPDAVITFNSVGFQSREVSVSTRRVINVTLEIKLQELSEISISTGYQTLKKSQLTGSYASINRESYLESVPTAGNIVQNMEGKLPGLVLNINDSRGSESPFTIRGVSTFQAIKKPLIVLDGFPTEIEIESLNPYDIESITILKDAASAAIYGVRASNGVIVITTKKGKKGSPTIQLTTAFTYKPKPDYSKLDLLSGRDYLTYVNAANLRSITEDDNSVDYYNSINAAYLPAFKITDDVYNNRISKAEGDKLFDQLGAYDNTDDYKRLFLQNEFYRSYDLSISGGNENSTNYFGFNHQDNSESNRYSNNSRTNAKYSGNFSFLDRFQLEVQGIYSNLTSKRVPVPDYLSFEPYQKFEDENGNPLPTFLEPYNYNYYGFGPGGTINAERNEQNKQLGLYDVYYYPVQEMKESSTKSSNNIFHIQGMLKTKITKSLNLEIGGVFEREAGTITDYASQNAWETRLMLNYFSKKDPFTGLPIFVFPKGGVKKSTDGLVNSHTLRAQLNFSKELDNGKHLIGFIAGAEQRGISRSSRLSTAFGYNPNTLTTEKVDLSLIRGSFTPGYRDVLVPSGSGVRDQTYFYNYFDETYNEDRFVSVYMNGDYVFNKKYVLTGSLRIDQSNLFGKNPKYRYTPLWSAGASWNIGQENFLAKENWLDLLRIRVSGGYNGNIINETGPFSILYSQSNYYTPNTLVGYAIRTPPNSSLRWEKTFNFNTGIDFGILSNRISGSIDYYIKTGKDIFSPLETDPTKGFSNLMVNNASIRNSGLDINLVFQTIHTSRFQWKSQLTGSFNKSEILNLKDQYTGFANFFRVLERQNEVGYPVDAVFTMDYIGLNEDGYPMVRGEDGKPIVLSAMPLSDIPFNAMKFSGVNAPKYTLGFNNQFTLHNFSLSALLMYYGGHVGLVAPPMLGIDRPVKGIQNYWKEPGDEKDTDIPGFLPWYVPSLGYEYGSKFVRKMDFIALRNVTLSYHLDHLLTGKAGIKNTQLKLQVSNAAKYVFSGNDIDPETLNFFNGARGLAVVPSYSVSFTTNF